MENANMILKRLAISRLSELGCEKLPPSVTKMVVSSFAERAEQRLTRLARREITVPKIAKYFARGLGQEGVLEGGAQAPPSNEMGSANDASSRMSQNP